MNLKQGLRAAAKRNKIELWKASQIHTNLRRQLGDEHKATQQALQTNARLLAKAGATKLARVGLMQRKYPKRKTKLVKRIVDEANTAIKVGKLQSRRGKI